MSLLGLKEDMNFLSTKEEQVVFACKHGSDSDSLELLKELMEKYGSNLKLYSIVDKANQNCSLLHICAKLNKVSCMEFLHQNKVPLEGQDDIRATPLIYAVGHNCIDSSAYLISNGANCNAKDIYNKYPLVLALKNKNYHIASMLMNNCDVHLKGTKGNTGKWTSN
jgi:ankyrin repeat protein